MAIAIVCLLFSLALSPAVFAEEDYKITYILSDERNIYQELIHQTDRERISYSKLKLEEVTKKSLNRKNTDLVISLGTKATKKALETVKNTPVLALFITRNNYLEISKQYHKQDKRLFSAIFIDQPVSRQLKLIKSVFPEKNHIGVAVSAKSKIHIPALIKTSGDLGLRIHIETLPSPDDIHRIIRKLAQNNDMILAIQDSQIYNKYTIQNILMTTYHAGIPVIGYSKPYVKAGSLMSVYASVDDVARNTEEIITKMAGSKYLPKPDYCKYYSIELNNQVARSLGIDLDNKDTLRKRIEKMNKEHRDE